MRHRTSETVTKRTTKVSVRSDILAAARKAGIDLSAALEQALVERLAEVKREKWRQDNREAIDAYNEYVKEHGMFSDGVRTF
ncbi:MAG: acetoacetyl-CoA synthase [Rhodospirillales bacterium]|nr:acetoacetyl-CoA synthase [Rhodospirillales bacterium]